MLVALMAHLAIQETPHAFHDGRKSLLLWLQRHNGVRVPPLAVVERGSFS